MTVARHGEGVLISQSRKERRGHADEKFRFFHFHLPMALPSFLSLKSLWTLLILEVILWGIYPCSSVWIRGLNSSVLVGQQVAIPRHQTTLEPFQLVT